MEQSGKEKELEEIRRIAEMANFYYVRQKGPLGNATPIWNAREIVGNEPFIVLWGDEFMDSTPTRCQQLVKAYEEKQSCATLASIRKSGDEDYKRYGYADGKELAPGILQIDQFIEKPGPGRMKSDYAIMGGAVYEPEMFNAIEEAMARLEKENIPRELVYVDAVNILLERQRRCLAVEILGAKYYDCGNKLEYLKTVVEYGLKHEDLREDFANYLSKLKI